MSAFNGGGRTKLGTVINLNVYDLSPLNETALSYLGVGIHHSGVEVSGTEYSFAGGAGIFEDQPKQAGGAIYTHTVKLGVYEGPISEVKSILSEMRDSFGANSYNILCQNCNHFAEAFSLRLLGVGIPAYVNRIAYMGSFFSCLLPKELLEGKINNTSTGSYNWNAWR